MDRAGKRYTAVSDYESYSLPELKARLVAEFEKEFDQAAAKHDERWFLTFVTMHFSSLVRRSATQAGVSKRLESATASETVLLHWARMPSWGLGETASLLCGLDPNSVKGFVDNIGTIAGQSEVARKFVEINELLARANGLELSPVAVAAWADRFCIKMPDVLREAITRIWGTTADSDSEPIGKRERNSLLRIIAGLAKEARIDLAEGGKGAGQIAKAVQLAGFDGPKEKTVRDVLADVRNLD